MCTPWIAGVGGYLVGVVVVMYTAYTTFAEDHTQLETGASDKLKVAYTLFLWPNLPPVTHSPAPQQRPNPCLPTLPHPHSPHPSAQCIMCAAAPRTF